MVRRAVAILLVALAPAASAATPAPPGWPGDEMPLPLSVKSPQDLSFKTEAERQYLIFNLMTAGKVAFEQGDYNRAVQKWQMLLRLPNLPPEIERVVRPFLQEAQQRGGEAGAAPLPPLVAHPEIARAPEPVTVAVSGTLTGGGLVGPGAAVVWLRRLDGPTPAPRAAVRTITQKNKAFVPRVLAVPVGSTVEFRNDDVYYHNVFSLSGTQKFDTGIDAAGISHRETFRKAGLVELLCNIHASMRGYLYVVDSVYYAQPRPNGTFTIRGVPPGRYELSAWHEVSAEVIKQTIQVGAAGTHGITINIPQDRPPSVVVPDKYGKPRQPQLGY
jgi:plastocyanin